MRRKTKRLLSFITAAAMSASAFAGLTISASAEGDNVMTLYDQTAAALPAGAKLIKATKTDGVLTAVEVADPTAAAFDATAHTYTIADAAAGATYYLWDMSEEHQTPLAPPAVIPGTITPGPDTTTSPNPSETEDPSTTTSPNPSETEDPSTTPEVIPTDTPISDVGDDFESYTVAESLPAEKWSSSGQYAFTVESDATLDSNVLKATANGSGGRTSTLKFTNAVTQTDNPIKIEYKWNSTTTIGSCSTIVSLVDSTGKNIIGLEETAGNAILLNRTTDTNLQRGWYTISATIDFETKTVLDFTITANGSDEPSATYKNVPFVSNEAVDLAGFYIDGQRAANQTLTSTVLLDDVKLYTSNSYFKATITVTDKDEQPVDDATVVIDDVTYTTDAQGKVVVKLTKAGSHTYTISKIGYTSTGEAGGEANVTGAITSDSANVDAKLSLVPYTAEVTTATVSGGQKIICAPTGDTAATSTAYTVAVADQNEQPMTEGYTTAWAVYEKDTETSVSGVTVSEGVVSVTKDFNAGEGKDALECDVVATVTDSKNNQKKVTAKGSIIIANSDILVYDMDTSFTASGDKSRDYDIPDVTIPTGGVHITFTYYKGAYDSQSDSSYGQLAFKNGSDTVFYLKDTNADQLVLYTDDAHSVKLGDTARNTPYSIDLTIIGTLLIASFNGGDNVVIEFPAAPTAITGITASTSQNGGSGTGAEDLKISSKVTVDTNGVRIGGKDKIAMVTGKTVTKKYTATAYVPLDGETFTWAVTKKGGEAATGLSIEDGTLTIDPTATAGDYTITATSSESDEKAGSLDITVAEAVPAFEITGPTTVDVTAEEATYSVDKITDQFGDDITDALKDGITWAVKAEDGTGAATATMAGGKLSFAANEVVTVQATVLTTTVSKKVTIAKYSKVDTYAAGKIAVNDLAADDKITGYQVTVADADGKMLGQQVTAKADATEGADVPTVADGTPDQMEVAPVYSITSGIPSTDSRVTFNVPADFYNVKVQMTGERADIYANEQLLINNMLQYGTTPDTDEAHDIYIKEGYANINTRDYSSGKTAANSTVSAITLVKAPSIVNRKTKMYVLGDSLVCKYYNGGSSENRLAQTGWGQVLQNYITDDIEVVDIANSGVTADGLLHSAYSQVMESAQEGDYVVLESGYNDNQHSTMEIMKAAVTEMVTGCKAKNLNIVLVSPNASQHDYRESVQFTSGMSEVATATDTDFIDLSKLSYQYLVSLYSTDGFTQDLALATWNVNDRLHSTYNAANKWASIMATELGKIYPEANMVNTSYTYTFTDTVEPANTITCQATVTE